MKSKSKHFLSPLILSIVVEVVTRAISKKKNKGIQTGMEQINLYSENMVLYKEKSKYLFHEEIMS